MRNLGRRVILPRRSASVLVAAWEAESRAALQEEPGGDTRAGIGYEGDPEQRGQSQRLRELEHRTRSLLRQRQEALHQLHVLLQKEKVDALQQLHEALEQEHEQRQQREQLCMEKTAALGALKEQLMQMESKGPGRVDQADPQGKEDSLPSKPLKRVAHRSRAL
ncbi:hypothetical protein GRJ2_002139600 [Grus japonensis]|uniref:Uncharacterized protein n=1 Tax=Grus japonensis TaxID=30415 RepID=A0ABC9XGC1_GRUJA